MANRFTHRSSKPELMDASDVPQELLCKNLHELDVLNRNTKGHAVTLRGVKKLINGSNKKYSIADLGCGSGDALKYIADWGRKNRYKFELIGIDKSSEAIRYLNQHCKNYPEIKGVVSDVFEYFGGINSIDIVISSLFFHHLNNSELLKLFSQMKEKTHIGIVINDLQRNRIPYYGSWLITRILNGTKLSKNDGPLSVLKAFKKKELEELLHQSGIKKYTIEWKWLFRYLVVCNNQKSN